MINDLPECLRGPLWPALPKYPKSPALIEAERRIEILRSQCKWEYNEADNYYRASCGHDQWFDDGNPEENGYVFCPHCGKKIVPA